jgi:hypothetical protein
MLALPQLSQMQLSYQQEVDKDVAGFVSLPVRRVRKSERGERSRRLRISKSARDQGLVDMKDCVMSSQLRILNMGDTHQVCFVSNQGCRHSPWKR